MSDSMDVQEKFATACKDGNLEAARQILLQDWEVGDINVNFRDNVMFSLQNLQLFKRP